MIVTLSIVALLLAVFSAGLLARAVKSAPEGTEDEAGFRPVAPLGQDRVVPLASAEVDHPALTLHHPAA